ncbi:ABC transporter substrate-binding protein [Nocardioides sp.]|uniref:ABC transporter substrate-binding protein n=1 Tax=Nocardioides sp. TaxID=35761 RepID=UPI0035663F43
MNVRRSLAAALAAGALLFVTACSGDLESSDDGDAQAKGQGPVTISGQNFPEATLVASMYEQLLADAGYEPTVKLVGGRDVYGPDFPGKIDIVPEYVGGIANYLNIQANGPDAEPFTSGDGEEIASQAEPLFDELGITLLELSEATDTNAFFVTKEFAEENDVSTLSDLEGMSMVLAAAPDCKGRLDCEGGLSEAYGIDITKVLPLGYASDQTYQSVIDGEAQLGETSTTDGTLEAQGLVVLEDDQQIQPAQNLVPAVGEAFLTEHPDVADLLNALMAALTTEKLTELNGRVSNDREKPEDVARDFLVEEGLL